MPSHEKRYDWPIERWETAKDEIVDALSRRAPRGEPIFYGELAALVTAIDLEPHLYAMAAILDEVAVVDNLDAVPRLRLAFEPVSEATEPHFELCAPRTPPAEHLPAECGGGDQQGNATRQQGPRGP